jgi:hypothetical protein
MATVVVVMAKQKKRSSQRIQLIVPPEAEAAWLANRAAQAASVGSKHSRDSNYLTALDTAVSARAAPPADNDTASVHSATSSGNDRPNIQRRLSDGVGDSISVSSETHSAHALQTAFRRSFRPLQTSSRIRITSSKGSEPASRTCVIGRLWWLQSLPHHKLRSSRRSRRWLLRP